MIIFALHISSVSLYLNITSSDPQDSQNSKSSSEIFPGSNLSITGWSRLQNPAIHVPNLRAYERGGMSMTLVAPSVSKIRAEIDQKKRKNSGSDVLLKDISEQNSNTGALSSQTSQYAGIHFKEYL